MIEALIVSPLVKVIADEILRRSLKGLGKKYSVDIKYVLNSEIQKDFYFCLDVAIQAFIDFMAQNGELSSSRQEVLVEYLKSESVSEEVWHLLDPGSEYFDRGQLTQDGYPQLSVHFKNLDPETLFEAWEEFLKAFSFASRSTPAFREFLRASYEAGSFKALSNIDGVLEKMGEAIDEIRSEELVARKSIEDYIEELKVYRDWATGFQAIDLQRG
jgi:hypothetical protein